MKLETITRDADFLALRPHWEKICSDPLRSFDWTSAWWTAFGDELELRTYVLEQHGDVVGIAPCFIDRWLGQSRLRFMGTGTTCSDYVRFVAQPGVEQQLADEIARDLAITSIGMLEMEGVCEETPETATSVRSVSGYWRYEKELEPVWVMELPESWEQFVGQSKKSLKRKIKKATKRLEQRQVIVRSTLDGELEFGAAFQTLVRLHQERFVSKGLPGVFADERFEKFLCGAAEPLCKKRQAEILVAETEGEPLAAQIYLRPEHGVQLYQAGIRADKMELEPGHLMLTFAVRRAIESGCRMFDFLRGNEPYKPYWGASPRRLLNRRFISRSPVPTAVNQAYRAARALRTFMVTCARQFGSIRPLQPGTRASAR